MSAPCPICHSPKVAPKLRKGSVDILQCAECGVAFWRPDDDFDPAAVYGGEYFDDAGADAGYSDYAALEPALRASFAGRLSRLTAPGDGARLLDLGAAYGFAVDEARLAGWRAFGVDRAGAALARAPQTARERLVLSSGGALPFATGSFAAATLWDVIEHLPDPHACLAEVARVCSPGARLAISTGDVESRLARVSGARWHLYTLPEHLFFFSEGGLRCLLEEHGFRVDRVLHEGSTYTLGYLVERLSKTLVGGLLPRRARFPGAGLNVPVNLFDVMTVYATRS